jgi:hypothetical protein
LPGRRCAAPDNVSEFIMLLHLLKRLRERYRVPGSLERHAVERASSYDLGVVLGRSHVDVEVEHGALGGSKRVAAQVAADAARARAGAPQFGF